MSGWRFPFLKKRSRHNFKSNFNFIEQVNWMYRELLYSTHSKSSPYASVLHVINTLNTDGALKSILIHYYWLKPQFAPEFTFCVTFHRLWQIYEDMFTIIVSKTSSTAPCSPSASYWTSENHWILSDFSFPDCGVWGSNVSDGHSHLEIHI